MNADLRRLFPVTERYAYFDHASVAPLSTRVSEAMQWLIGDIQGNGGRHYPVWARRQDEVRAAAARLIGAAASQIAFIPHTSEGVAAVANGLSWRPGDNVVSCAAEFPANVYPWLNLAARGVELRLAPERAGRVSTEALLRLIDGRTRAVALSSVQYATGQRMDLRAVGRHCRERDILFFVDAIQSLGALKLDVEADYVDALAANSHKFLLGAGGVGLLYLSARALDRVTPAVVGWMSVENWADAFAPDFSYAPDRPLTYRAGAARFESGTVNMHGVFGLGAALDLILEIGVERIEQHLLDLSDYLCEGLGERGYQVISPRAPGEKSAVVCCTHPRHSAGAVHHHLLTQNVVTASRCGRLRIAPHCYNTRDEVDRLLAALPS